MKLITILFCLSILISAGMAAETKVPIERVNWSQSLPLNANITLGGGDVIGQTFATQYDTIVRQDGTNIYAMYGKNKTSIDAGAIGSTVNSRVIRSAINATGVAVKNMEMRGLRGIVTETGYRSDIKLSGCDINTSGNCFMIYGVGSTALFTACDFHTSNPSQYLINVQSNAAASLIGCHGSSSGLVYVGGTNGVLTHSGTSGLGLEAYGATSVADGGTIAHGMKIAPTYATATGSLAGTTVTVTAKDATHLKIDLAGVTTTQTVYWHAVY